MNRSPRLSKMSLILTVGLLAATVATGPHPAAAHTATKKTHTPHHTVTKKHKNPKPTRIATPPVPKATTRIIGVGYENVTHPETLPAINTNMNNANVNGVSISVGRTDWALFPTKLGPNAQSYDVQDTHTDYVQNALNTVGYTPAGRKRTTVLVIDTMVDRWITRDPSIAGIGPTGKPSTEFPSMSALETGPVGDAIVTLAGETAARYHPDGVSLTELINTEYTFGVNDLQSYRAHTGNVDWPRKPDNTIDMYNPKIGAWRADILANLTTRAAAATHAHNTPLWFEARVNWSNPHADRLETGHDYNKLLKAADKIVLWGYFGTANRSPKVLETHSRAAFKRAPTQFVMSVGLWGDPETTTITPAALKTAVTASAKGGLTNMWVTPASKMTPAHWAVLRKLWKP